jgi:hypothetical protein
LCDARGVICPAAVCCWGWEFCYTTLWEVGGGSQDTSQAAGTYTQRPRLYLAAGGVHRLRVCPPPPSHCPLPHCSPPAPPPPALLPRPAPPAQTLTRLLPCLAWCMSFAGVKPRKPRAGLRGNAHGVGCPWDSSPEPCVGNTQGVPTTHIPARPPAFGAGVG